MYYQNRMYSMLNDFAQIVFQISIKSINNKKTVLLLFCDRLNAFYKWFEFYAAVKTCTVDLVCNVLFGSK